MGECNRQFLIAVCCMKRERQREGTEAINSIDIGVVVCQGLDDPHIDDHSLLNHTTDPFTR